MTTLTIENAKAITTKIIKIVSVIAFVGLVLSQMSYDKNELENEIRIQQSK